MSNTKSWYFPSTGGIGIDGFKSSSREFFAGLHEKSLTREMIQNSIDVKTPGSKDPVKFIIELSRVKPAAIEGCLEMKDFYEKAKKFGGNQDGANEYYDNALKLLNSDEIMVLRLGDYNTVGSDGADDDTNGNWARLTRMEGASSKKGAGGGAFGIGKNAAFAASGLRLVYYVTRTNSDKLAYQGKATISSFQDNAGDVKRGIGLFGYVNGNGVASVREEAEIPEMFHRKERGTDTYVIGYTPSSDEWHINLMESVLTNFWPAIHHGELEVEIRGDDRVIEINSDNLKSHLESYETTAEESLPYYRALTETTPIEATLNHLKQVKLYVKLGDDMPKKVLMMRKPLMVVETKRVYTLHQNYAAVFVCVNDTGDHILRSLEPPAHDQWKDDLADGKHKPAMDELRRFLRESLRGLNPQMDDEPQDIEGLGKYLPDIEERDDMGGFAIRGETTDKTTGTETPRETGAIAEKVKSKIKLPEKQALTIISSARGSDTPRMGTVDRTNETHDDKASEEEGGNLPRVDTSGLAFRSFATKGSGGYEYHIVLKPARDTSGALRIVAIGEDADYPVELRAATNADGEPIKVSGSYLKNIDLVKDVPQKLILNLSSSRRYALGVETYEG